MAVKNLEAFITQQLFWLGQSGFKIIFNSGLVLYFDPFKIPAQSEPADLIFISHPHPDHFNIQATNKLKQDGTVIVTPERVAREGFRGLAPGKTIEIKSLKITGVPAYNVKKNLHSPAQQWLGYLVEVDGIKIYHAGDTDCIPEMQDLRPDIALLPVGGFFTMDVKEAVRAAELVKPQVVVPMHYGIIPGTKGAGKKFAKLWAGTTKVLMPLK